MTLDSLPDLDTSGLCLVKNLPTALTCWPYRNTALRDGARPNDANFSHKLSSSERGRIRISIWLGQEVARAVGRGKTLFEPVVAPEKLNPHFEQIRTFPGAECARWMFDDVYQSFSDPDGNFLEQFQTTGFDARCFELYLFAYFSRSGFAVDRSRPNPDFLVSREGLTVAVEATTV